jgi:hypothetical protein
MSTSARGGLGAERAEEAQPPQRFGGSVPLEKALRPEVLLQQVEVRADPFDGYFQETAYRILRPDEQAPRDWASSWERFC